MRKQNGAKTFILIDSLKVSESISIHDSPKMDTSPFAKAQYDGVRESSLRGESQIRRIEAIQIRLTPQKRKVDIV